MLINGTLYPDLVIYIYIILQPQHTEESQTRPEKRKNSQQTPESTKKSKLKPFDVDLENAPSDGNVIFYFQQCFCNRFRYHFGKSDSFLRYRIKGDLLRLKKNIFFLLDKVKRL
jgi:hypothetical protein